MGISQKHYAKMKEDTKTIYCMILLIRHSIRMIWKRAKLVTESRLVVARGWTGYWIRWEGT
jgi:hypothetical protein